MPATEGPLACRLRWPRRVLKPASVRVFPELIILLECAKEPVAGETIYRFPSGSTVSIQSGYPLQTSPKIVSSSLVTPFKVVLDERVREQTTPKAELSAVRWSPFEHYAK